MGFFSKLKLPTFKEFIGGMNLINKLSNFQTLSRNKQLEELDKMLKESNEIDPRFIEKTLNNLNKAFYNKEEVILDILKTLKEVQYNPNNLTDKSYKIIFDIYGSGVLQKEIITSLASYTPNKVKENFESLLSKTFHGCLGDFANATQELMEDNERFIPSLLERNSGYSDSDSKISALTAGLNNTNIYSFRDKFIEPFDNSKRIDLLKSVINNEKMDLEEKQTFFEDILESIRFRSIDDPNSPLSKRISGVAIERKPFPSCVDFVKVAIDGNLNISKDIANTLIDKSPRGMAAELLLVLKENEIKHSKTLSELIPMVSNEDTYEMIGNGDFSKQEVEENLKDLFDKQNQSNNSDGVGHLLGVIKLKYFGNKNELDEWVDKGIMKADYNNKTFDFLWKILKTSEAKKEAIKLSSDKTLETIKNQIRNGSLVLNASNDGDTAIMETIKFRDVEGGRGLYLNEYARKEFILAADLKMNRESYGEEKKVDFSGLVSFLEEKDKKIIIKEGTLYELNVLSEYLTEEEKQDGSELCEMIKHKIKNEAGIEEGKKCNPLALLEVIKDKPNLAQFVVESSWLNPMDTSTNETVVKLECKGDSNSGQVIVPK